MLVHFKGRAANDWPLARSGQRSLQVPAVRTEIQMLIESSRGVHP